MRREFFEILPVKKCLTLCPLPPYSAAMLIGIAIANVAIALLCLILAARMRRLNHQVIQLNRDLNRWTVLLENTLPRQALTLTQKRTDLQRWQLNHLQWQLQQRRIAQIAKFLKLMVLFSRRRFL